MSGLAEKLVAESEAYGYSLCTWAVGGLLVDALGLPGLPDVVGYVGGAVTGFLVLAALTFDGLFTETDLTDRPLFVASMVHAVSVLGTVVGAWALIEALAPVLGATAVFAVAGVHLTVTYNALLAVEDAVVHRLQ